MKGNKIFYFFLKTKLPQKKSLRLKKCLSHWITVLKKRKSLSHWVTVFKKKYVCHTESLCLRTKTVKNGFKKKLSKMYRFCKFPTFFDRFFPKHSDSVWQTFFLLYTVTQCDNFFSRTGQSQGLLYKHLCHS